MLADAAAKDMDTHDVFVCGCLMRNGRRAKGNASSRMALHADLDGGYDEAKVRAVGGCAIGSGTPGHAHVYVPRDHIGRRRHLRTAVPAVRRDIGAADAKVVDNDVLRLIGTNNHKPRVYKNGRRRRWNGCWNMTTPASTPGVRGGADPTGPAALRPQAGFSSNGQRPADTPRSTSATTRRWRPRSRITAGTAAATHARIVAPASTRG